MTQSPSNTEKIGLFLDVFRGREDVFAAHWQNGTKQGYKPVSLKLSASFILDHFQGKRTLGLYPLLSDNTCWLIAGDFDNHDGQRDPLTDVKEYYAVCEVQGIPCYVLRSRSGKGYHAYVFFKAPVAAWKARTVALALLEEAQVITKESASSFDRLFPNQNALSGKGYGNLIALPFQGNAAKDGHTLLLDPGSDFTEPYADQWECLQDLKPIDEATLDSLIDEWHLDRLETISHLPAISTEDNYERLFECNFIKWCSENPEKVPEPLWYALLSNVVCLRPGGYSMAHELSRGYPQYTRQETDEKLHHALDGPGPHTCTYIRDNGFKCPKVCSVMAPAGLWGNNRNGEPENVHRVTATLIKT